VKGGVVMGNLQRRIKSVEERFGMGRDDEIVEFTLNDGRGIRLTRGQWNRIIAEVMGASTRPLPMGDRHG
jgi:hypothetical protein